MLPKELFQLNRLVYKIKLDNSENDFLFFPEEEKAAEYKMENEKFLVNEWDQEYELIYSSYVLEK